MSAFVFNVAHGTHGHYATLPAASDGLVLVLLKLAGVESDATLKDYDTLAAILAAANDECDFTGYTRRTLANVSSVVDDTADARKVDADDPASYTNGGASAQVGAKGIVCYDPDTGAGTDADLIPLYCFDLNPTVPASGLTFDPGVPTTVQVNASGLATAS